MPKFVTLGQIHHVPVSHIHQHDFSMSASTIGQRGYRKIISTKSPFAMVKSIARRSLYRANQLSCAIGDQKPLMGTIIFTHVVTTGLTAKIKEQGALATILRQGHIASLLFVIPHRIMT